MNESSTKVVESVINAFIDHAFGPDVEIGYVNTPELIEQWLQHFEQPFFFDKECRFYDISGVSA